MAPTSASVGAGSSELSAGRQLLRENGAFLSGGGLLDVEGQHILKVALEKSSS